MSKPKLVFNVAAKAVIVRSDGKILILREAATNPDGTNVGKYHMPGGRLDVGEAFIDALRREVKEEAGIDIEPLRPVHVDEWRPVIRGTVHQIVGVLCYVGQKRTQYGLARSMIILHGLILLI